MERKANYLAVGSFVLLVLAMGVLFIYWYSSAYSRGHYRSYEIYFNGSVSGLSVGSTVRYLGVDVGQVQNMRIDPRSAERVQIVVDIDADTPISNRTVAQLSLQGITGLLSIDLHQLKGAAEPPSAQVPGEKYPVIASEQSNLDALLTNLPALAGRLEDLLDRTSRLLSDSNIDAFGHIATHLDAATAGLPRALNGAAELIAQLHATVRQADQILSDVHAASKPASIDAVAILQKLRTVSDNLARSTGRLDAFMAANGGQIAGLVHEGVPQLEALLRDSRAAIEQINGLARTLRDDPSRLLYQPRRGGVSIPP